MRPNAVPIAHLLPSPAIARRRRMARILKPTTTASRIAWRFRHIGHLAALDSAQATVGASQRAPDVTVAMLATRSRMRRWRYWTHDETSSPTSSVCSPIRTGMRRDAPLRFITRTLMNRLVSEKPYKGFEMEGFTARWYASLTRKASDEFKALARRVAEQIPPTGYEVCCSRLARARGGIDFHSIA